MEDYILDPLKRTQNGRIVPLPDGNRELRKWHKRIPKAETTVRLWTLKVRLMK